LDTVIFISDVHLGPREQAKLDRLLSVLRGPETAYLVGDIFEYWVGPAPREEPAYRRLLEESARLGRDGKKMFFIGGNRDFLLDEAVGRAAGIRVLGREASLRLGARRVRVEHGDVLFDRSAREGPYRRAAKAGMIQGTLRKMPAGVLRTIGRVARRMSRGRPRRWSEDEIFLRAAPALSGAHDTLVCGHIHQPGIWTREGKTVVVLGDWDHDGTHAVFDGELRLRTA
jgi:UDP-2,3-diacylglucosamine hydrolase